ncbi:MAG: serine O-acetyltransferase [Actinobacteria bacterium]|nr:MAG: serine O-acetyltransferase [Actinomycetota bacterium]
MFKHIRRDIEAILDRDPAATGTLEAFLAYPGLHALWSYRVAHWLYEHKRRLLARLISECARFVTGIEIHPGARIGEGFFIDHGMGTVIGETTEIGNNVSLYQGVTLGGTGKEKGKRHPTIEDNVVVGVGATVLGSITVGKNAKIGAGAVVVNPVPPNSTVVGVPGHVVVQEGERIQPLDLHHERLPDPVVEMFSCISRRIDRLEHRLAEREGETGGAAAERGRETGAVAGRETGEAAGEPPAEVCEIDTVKPSRERRKAT